MLNGQAMIKQVAAWQKSYPGHTIFSRFLLHITIPALFAAELLTSKIVLMFPITTFNESADWIASAFLPDLHKRLLMNLSHIKFENREFIFAI